MRPFFRGAWVIAWQKVFSNVVRDRVAQLFLFVLPLATTLVVGGAGASSGQIVLGGVLPRDHATAVAFQRATAASPVLRVRWIADRSEAFRLLARQEVGGVLDVSVPEGHPRVDLWLDRGRLDPGVVSGPVMSVLSDVSRRTEPPRLAVRLFGLDPATAMAAPNAPDTTDEEGAATTPTTETSTGPRITRLDTGPAKPIGGFAFAAVGNLVLFAFVTTFGTAVALLNDRDEGQLERIVTAAIPRSSILAGHLLARVIIGTIQVAFVVAFSTVLFHVTWGPLWLVALLAVPFVVTSACVGLLAATWYRSNEQASLMTGLIGFPAAMLAGCFWPLQVVSPALRFVGHIVPQAWLVDGLLELSGGAGAASIGGEVAILTAVAVVSLAACLWRVTRFLSTHPVRSTP